MAAIELTTALAYTLTGIRTAIRVGPIYNARDFGAKGDGVTNDWLSLQRALSAAAGFAQLHIPQGTYIISQELKVPSNSYVFGDGIGETIIKLSNAATASQCVMTNSQNTRSYLTNQGNTNITIKDLELDGNLSRFPGSYSPVGDTSGTGLCLAYVTNSVIERVAVHDTCRHCFDICAPETSITLNPLDYVPNPSSNIHLKDIIAYAAGDDNITTHFSNNIIIENAYVPYTSGTEVPTNSNGIEIDDGSYDVTIIGGYIKNCRRGLEVKGHSWAPAAKRVNVYGLVCERNVRNFGIRHLGFDNTDSKTAFDVALYDCTSINPVSSIYTTDNPRALQISNYSDVYIKNFKVVGEIDASRAVTIQERARNVFIDGMSFVGVSGINTGITEALFYADGSFSAMRNIKVKNVTFSDCIGQPMLFTGSISGVEVENIDAFTTVYNAGSSRVVEFTWSPLDTPYTVKNVTFNGYTSAFRLGGSHSFDYLNSSNIGLVENIVPASPATADTQYVAARFGWQEGTGQALNANIGAEIEFTCNLLGGISARRNAPIAYITTKKTNASDTDLATNLVFGTRDNTATGPIDRLTITSTGVVSARDLVITNNVTFSGSSIRFTGLPTSSVGLPAGSVWNNGGVLNIV